MSTVLVTGASGSLGTQLIAQLLQDPSVTAIRALARDIHKLNTLLHTYPVVDESGAPILRILVGDVRDKDRMLRATEHCDIVYHLAALKHIDIGQVDVAEFAHTNIVGTLNVINACKQNGVKKAMFSSTDKSVNPSSVYGSTKLVAEQAWIVEGNTGKHDTKFSACRYGNVLGSRGSVVEIWTDQVARGEPITITDPNHSRFYLTLPQAARFVLGCTDEMQGQEVFIPKLNTATTEQLADALFPNAERRYLHQVRPGEKVAELLLGPEESEYAYDYGSIFIRYPGVDRTLLSPVVRLGGEPVPAGFIYSSANAPRLSKEKIMEMVLD